MASHTSLFSGNSSTDDNFTIVSKYTNIKESIKSISQQEMMEDFMKIQIANTPIENIFMIKFMGEYINQFSNYLKWVYYDKIDLELIDQCKKTWPELQIDYTQLIKIVCMGKIENNYIFKVKNKILDYIDNVHVKQYQVKDYHKFENIQVQMKYLEFRTQSDTILTELFGKYNFECNEIDEQMEDFMEKVYENFASLESDENFMIVTQIFDTLQSDINKFLNKLITQYGSIYKTECIEKNIKNPHILQEIKKKLEEKFDSDMNKIYKEKFTEKFNNLDENTVSNLLDLFSPDKQINKIGLTLELALVDGQNLIK
jgi:hypothetical protein